MQALLETTDWGKGVDSNHIYLLDGNNLVAYIKQNETKPFYFKTPIKGFDKRGRKFVEVKPNPFKTVSAKHANPLQREFSASEACSASAVALARVWRRRLVFWS